MDVAMVSYLSLHGLGLLKLSLKYDMKKGAWEYPRDYIPSPSYKKKKQREYRERETDRTKKEGQQINQRNPLTYQQARNMKPYKTHPATTPADSTPKIKKKKKYGVRKRIIIRMSIKKNIQSARTASVSPVPSPVAAPCPRSCISSHSEDVPSWT